MARTKIKLEGSNKRLQQQTFSQVIPSLSKFRQCSWSAAYGNQRHDQCSMRGASVRMETLHVATVGHAAWTLPGKSLRSLKHSYLRSSYRNQLWNSIALLSFVCGKSNSKTKKDNVSSMAPSLKGMPISPSELPFSPWSRHLIRQ